jgi:hypothetical protein
VAQDKVALEAVAGQEVVLAPVDQNSWASVWHSHSPREVPPKLIRCKPRPSINAYYLSRCVQENQSWDSSDLKAFYKQTPNGAVIRY